MSMKNIFENLEVFKVSKNILEDCVWKFIEVFKKIHEKYV
jgi:hypothetical protein